MMDMMRDGTMMWGSGGWWPGPIVPIGFFLLFLILVVAIVKWMSKDGRSHYSQESAMSILDKRYAAGELDEAEYDRRKQKLRE